VIDLLSPAPQPLRFGFNNRSASCQIGPLPSRWHCWRRKQARRSLGLQRQAAGPPPARRLLCSHARAASCLSKTISRTLPQKVQELLVPVALDQIRTNFIHFIIHTTPNITNMSCRRRYRSCWRCCRQTSIPPRSCGGRSPTCPPSLASSSSPGLTASWPRKGGPRSRAAGCAAEQSLQAVGTIGGPQVEAFRVPSRWGAAPGRAGGFGSGPADVWRGQQIRWCGIDLLRQKLRRAKARLS